MKFISTRQNSERISFKDAVVNGLSNNGGLYVPESIPKLPNIFFQQLKTTSDTDIAYQVLKPFVGTSLTEQQLKTIVSETLSFPTPVIPVQKDMYILELFHGPTKAFKDVGARFMSRCLSYFFAEEKKQITILVATSGDTGSAVANGFYNVPNVHVKIAFPKGKISHYQEHQMTSLGKNIQAIEVDGTFDDCQQLVKDAFNDSELRDKITLSSANSINVARLLPQMLYYFFATKQLLPLINERKLMVAVPSGNLGNITAGLIAKKMGLPIHRFIAALNDNDTFLKYLNSGTYKKKPSVLTYANAMDVGNPSNFERIEYMFNADVSAIRGEIASQSFSNTAIIEEIKACYEQNNYLLDPHAAVGKLGLTPFLNGDNVGLFLGTAAPQKFSDVIKKALPDYKSDALDYKLGQKLSIANSYKALKAILFN